MSTFFHEFTAQSGKKFLEILVNVTRANAFTASSDKLHNPPLWLMRVNFLHFQITQSVVLTIDRTGANVNKH